MIQLYEQGLITWVPSVIMVIVRGLMAIIFDDVDKIKM